MPFIHIHSLPFDPPLPIGDIIQGICTDFARETGIDLAHVTVTWTFLPGGHYAVAGRVASLQPATSHPLLVDLLAPDFNDSEQVGRMLQAVAKSISWRAKMPIANIFIHHRQARSGRVFDAGEIVRW